MAHLLQRIRSRKNPHIPLHVRIDLVRSPEEIPFEMHERRGTGEPGASLHTCRGSRIFRAVLTGGVYSGFSRGVTLHRDRAIRCPACLLFAGSSVIKIRGGLDSDPRLPEGKPQALHSVPTHRKKRISALCERVFPNISRHRNMQFR